LITQVNRANLAEKVPPHVFFLGSAVFHYLGPSFAVLLFNNLGVLGVAWLRIASAAVIFGLWRRPWRFFFCVPPRQQRLLVGLGVVLGLMNACFYLAIAHLPLSTIGAIEFIGPITLAALGLRTRRNLGAFLLAAGGVWLLVDVRLAGDLSGFLFAFANCAFFVLYIILGHKIAEDGGATGIDRLGAAMIIALIVITPLGLAEAWPAFGKFDLLLFGIGVGICSSVIPYICDQLAMARLPRATFALLLALLPASATIIGVAVLGQLPALPEIGGIGLVIGGVALHQTKAQK
jgi:inner membrane transporter RhtA